MRQIGRGHQDAGNEIQREEHHADEYFAARNRMGNQRQQHAQAEGKQQAEQDSQYPLDRCLDRHVKAIPGEAEHQDGVDQGGDAEFHQDPGDEGVEGFDLLVGKQRAVFLGAVHQAQRCVAKQQEGCESNQDENGKFESDYRSAANQSEQRTQDQ
ncbi:hypothetical protein D3C73_1337820 [compost metagenome]